MPLKAGAHLAVEAPSEDGSRLSVPAPDLLEQLEREGDEGPRFLVEDIWGLEAVGFFAGGPKALKTWAQVELALAVATGVPAFGRFEPQATGSVLLVQEESATRDYARRLLWLARGHGLERADLAGVHVVSQRALRLDDPGSLAHLRAEVERIGPVFTGLDALARLHAADEDRRREMQPVLEAIRRLQADFGTAVGVVHHMAKPRGDRELRPGERMRGTGDMHAILDSAMYFDARPGTGLVAVEVEHREAAPPDPFLLRLEVDPEAGTARLVAEPGTIEQVAVIEALPLVEEALRARPDGATAREIQEALNLRRQVVYAALRRLEEAGRIVSEETKRPDRLGRMQRTTVWRLR